MDETRLAPRRPVVAAATRNQEALQQTGQASAAAKRRPTVRRGISGARYAGHPAPTELRADFRADDRIFSRHESDQQFVF